MKNLSNYSKQEIKNAFLKFIKNKQKCDKFTLGIYLDMICKTNMYALFNETYKRNELLEKLINKIEIDEYLYFIVSDSNYTQKQILNILNK